MDALQDALAAITGRRVADPALLRAATTHATWANEHPGDEDYERLEFLGDAVVQLCASELLAAAYPELREDGLNNLRQRVVDRDALADVARTHGLARFLRLGRGQAEQVAQRGHEPKLLCDVVEALFGATFVDGGLEPCRLLARAWLGPVVARLGPVARAAEVSNARNQLQEYTQRLWRVEPEFVDVEASGPAHARTHTVEVRVRGEALARGTRPTKKEAAKEAAALALGILRRREQEPGAA